MANTSDFDIDDSVEFTELPKDFFPECWKNDERMGVLFAPFRVKALNPLNYETKLTFWTNLINKYCEYKGSASFSVPELRCAFKRDKIKPYSLGTVLTEMQNSGKIKLTEKFLEAPQHTWRDWAQRSVKNAVALPFTLVKDRIWQRNPEELSYIVLDCVKKQGEKMQSTCSTGTVMSMEDVITNITETGLTAEGAELAIHYLHCNKRAAILTYINSEGNKITLIKIAAPNTEHKGITEQERAIYELNESLKTQTLIVERLEGEVTAADDEVRKYLREQKKSLAKMHLKRKHALEKSLEKNSDILNNVQMLLASIHESKQSVQVLDTYKAAANILKKSYEDSGITVDSADDTLADVKEAIENHEEIQTVIGGHQFNIAPTDDSVLEDELREILELEEKNAQEKAERALDESIERRLKQLNISGFAELSPEEQQRVLIGSMPSTPSHPTTAQPSAQ